MFIKNIKFIGITWKLKIHGNAQWNNISAHGKYTQLCSEGNRLYCSKNGADGQYWPTNLYIFMRDWMNAKYVILRVDSCREVAFIATLQEK